jgi:hypothetical protein
LSVNNLIFSDNFFSFSSDLVSLPTWQPWYCVVHGNWRAEKNLLAAGGLITGHWPCQTGTSIKWKSSLFQVFWLFAFYYIPCVFISLFYLQCLFLLHRGTQKTMDGIRSQFHQNVTLFRNQIRAIWAASWTFPVYLLIYVFWNSVKLRYSDEWPSRRSKSSKLVALKKVFWMAVLHRKIIVCRFFLPHDVFLSKLLSSICFYSGKCPSAAEIAGFAGWIRIFATHRDFFSSKISRRLRKFVFFLGIRSDQKII